jgi:nucleotide-binding universal stress UspA family protein
MKVLKNWMVAMDFSDHDQTLIDYTYRLAQAFVPDEIIFIHITPRVEIPHEFLEKEPTSKKELLSQLEERVYQKFTDQGSVKCEVHEGTPYFDMWRESYIHHTDLIIFGEKNVKNGRKIVPENFIRKSFCSVLFVPRAEFQVNRIWVPVDFSSGSKAALEFADQIRATYHNAEIICHHVFETPSLNLVAKEQQEDYIKYYKQHSQEKMKVFIKPLKIKEVKFHCTPWVYVKPSDHVKEEAEAHNADLIVMSSGGKNRISSFLLGSNTMEMVQLEKHLPVLILKEKIDRVKAWDILTNL